MQAGFEVSTPNGAIIVNETYTNILFDRKLKIKDLPYKEENRYLYFDEKNRLVSYGNKSRHYSCSINDDDIFFAISLVIGFNYLTFLSTGEKGKFTLIIPEEIYKSASMDDLYLYYFKNKTQAPKHSQYGIQVLNEQGKVVFDSDTKYMKIINYTQQYLPTPVPPSSALAINPFFYAKAGDDKRIREGIYGFKFEQNADQETGEIHMRSYIFEGLIAPSIRFFDCFPILLLDVSMY